tara:strand:+ start:4197 stop:4445 length:249 start_codon:yes stop_codon:yes gene_type:complete
MNSNNETTYINCFIEAFEIEADKINDDLAYQTIPEWDSIGHMSLISALEENFDISFDTDHIVDFESFIVGKKILTEQYNVTF